MRFHLKRSCQWRPRFMTGDAAGMITPLCGNGMAMAIHSAKIVSDLIIKHTDKKIFKRSIGTTIEHTWYKLFKIRLWFGRQVQKLFGNEWASNATLTLP